MLGEEIPTGAYGGSRLNPAREDGPPPLAYDGRGGLAALDESPPATDDAPILDAVADEADWMASILSDLVRAPTVLGNEEPGQAVMTDALRSLDLEPVDVAMNGAALREHPNAAPFDWDIEGKRNVVASWGAAGDGRSLILNGHIDVVSPEPLAQWGDRDAFSGEREGDWIYGRGAADMKCGLAAILGAVRGLRRLGLTPTAPVHIESVVEEECSGNGALMTLLAGYSADGVVIAEPFGAAITTAQVGVLWFQVRISGVPGHAAEANNAVNAIEESLVVIGALRDLEAELNAAPPPRSTGSRTRWPSTSARSAVATGRRPCRGSA